MTPYSMRFIHTVRRQADGGESINETPKEGWEGRRDQPLDAAATFSEEPRRLNTSPRQRSRDDSRGRGRVAGTDQEEAEEKDRSLSLNTASASH